MIEICALLGNVPMFFFVCILYKCPPLLMCAMFTMQNFKAKIFFIIIKYNLAHNYGAMAQCLFGTITCLFVCVFFLSAFLPAREKINSKKIVVLAAFSHNTKRMQKVQLCRSICSYFFPSNQTCHCVLCVIIIIVSSSDAI